jgi:hypothetical protein
MHGVRAQREAVVKIIALGGSVLYEYQLDEHGRYLPEPRRYQVSPRGPQWLRNLIGPHHFNSVANVNLFNTGMTDDDLACLDGLPRLVSLGVEQLAITSAGMVHLKHVPRLRWLFLDGTLVDDEGMQHVAELTDLELLSTSGKVSDRGLELLTTLAKLKELTLNSSQVTDHGLKHLESLQNLESLQLYQTQISDDGLEHLKGLKKLRFLDARGTNVTRQGADALKRSIPGLAIEMDRADNLTMRIVPGNGGQHITRLGLVMSGASAAVWDILPSSPASRSVVQKGDIVLAVDGEPISDAQSLLRASNKHDLGATISIKLRRREQEMIVDIVLDGM